MRFRDIHHFDKNCFPYFHIFPIFHTGYPLQRQAIPKVSRAKNLSPLPCRLDMLTLGLAHCLRAHSVILRENNEKKLAYAELTHWEISKKWCLTTGFAYATACFHRQICLQHQRCEDEEELEVEEEEEELRDRGAMCFDNFKNSSNDAVSLAPLQVRKGFCLRGHVGYYSKSQVQLTRCLRGAYAECGHSVGEL